MTTFDKSQIDVAELGGLELLRVVQALGLGMPETSEKLTNGGCAANYHVTFTAGDDVVVKACTGEDAEALAESQLAVLKHLALHAKGAAPPLKSLVITPCRTLDGKPAAAMAMGFVTGEAANLLLKRGEVGEDTVFRALGAALARVHAAPPAEGFYDVREGGYVERYVRCAAPLETHWNVHEPTGFAAWAVSKGRLAAARKAVEDASIPSSLLHGDAYADNVMLDGEDAMLVDWEDSAIGACAFDVATAAVGGCFDVIDDETCAVDVFPPVARPKLDVVAALLESYAAARGAFSAREAELFVPLMKANALACALYRFYQFHVAAPDSPEAGKRSYREIHAICLALEEERIAEGIAAVARKVVR